MRNNKAQLIGRLGKDPEVRRFENGGAVANFTLATKDFFKDRNGENKEETEWHNIVIKGKGADTAEKYLKKGLEIGVEGTIKTRTWDHEGVTKYIKEIICFNFRIFTPRDKWADSESQAPHDLPPELAEGQNVDDLPF